MTTENNQLKLEETERRIEEVWDLFQSKMNSEKDIESAFPYLFGWLKSAIMYSVENTVDSDYLADSIINGLQSSVEYMIKEGGRK